MCNFEHICNIVEQGVQTAYPGACLAIGVKENVLLKKAFGTVKIDTLFDMASVSKIMSTTMVALKYIEDGKMRLYDRMDFFFDVPQDKAGITVLNLLTHTSGLPAHIYISDFATSAHEAVDVIMAQPLLHDIGTMPVYSCLGFIVLGRILEKIGKAPLDRLAKNIVFDPLRLHNTTYHPQGDIAPTEYNPEIGEFLCGIVHDENAQFLKGISGNAGVFSTLDDVSAFAQMLALGGKTCDGTVFLSPATMQAALRNRTPGEQQEFRGLGFNLAGSPANFLGDLLSPQAFGHTGFVGTSIAVDPVTGLFVVLLTNRVCPTRNNVNLIRMRSLIHNAIAAEISKYY
ncbi:MAG: serine hydrolase [Spirochaetales bacterium]